MNSELQQQLDTLSNTNGIEGIKLDANGFCSLTVDNKWVVIHGDDATDIVTFVGFVAERLPADLDSSKLADLLSCGMSSLAKGGPFLGMDPNTGGIVLHRTVSFEELRTIGLPRTLEDFLSEQHHWCSRI